MVHVQYILSVMSRLWLHVEDSSVLDHQPAITIPGSATIMVSTTELPATVPPGQSPPFFTISPTDQAGMIVIVTAVCLITAAISVLARAFALTRLGTFRLHCEDWAVALALLLAIVQTSLVQREAAFGLGKTLQDVSERQGQHIQRLQFADQILYVLSVWLCKISVGLFFYRLSPEASERRISQGVLTFVGVTGVMGVLMISFVCDTAQPWRYFTAEGVTCTTPVSSSSGLSRKLTVKSYSTIDG